MIAKFHKTNRGLALAVCLFAGLAVATLTEAQYAAPRAPQTAESSSAWLQRTLSLAQSGDRWAVYCLWYAYYHGWHGVQPDQAEADKWLQQVVQAVWVVRFEPVDDFAPKTPREFMARIHQYSTAASGRDGEIGCFRTTRRGDRLFGSYLSYDPVQLTAALATVPGVKVTSVEKLTAETFIEYDKSRQESLEESPQKSLIDFKQLDAAKGVWAVRFEPVGDFSPRTPREFLARIPVYSGQHGEIGYFRTTKQGDKLAGAFLAYDPDQLSAALAALPGINVTSVEKLTQEQLVEYVKSPQESLESQ